MILLLLALGTLLASGAVALAGGRNARWVTAPAVVGTLLGAALGALPAVKVFLGGPAESWHWAWSVPYGAFSIELDALSAFFILPILLLTALAAVYGTEYLAPWRGRKNLGATWFLFNLLAASMVMVCLARNAVLFLMAWEIMALASFFLVTFDDEQASVREAGWIYLVATHLGTASLLVLFILMGRQAGSLDFDHWRPAAGWATPGLFFILAIIGFGTKAGFMPLHIWLPEAHPTAPSHVSALMSGVMIKTGIYGLCRILVLLGAPSPWWGWVMVGIGLSSGVLGILFALAQKDLKRLLAYSSVENIGVIALGLGLGLLGLSAGLPAVAVLGFAGSLLHVLNHALFKGLLFLGAGSVLHGAGTRNLEQLGGLLKRMPWTGMTFLIGAAAICGLPPLNGFVSEFLLFLGAYTGVIRPGDGTVLPAAAVLAGLALIGGLAAACFTKAFGVAFLGEPRSEPGRHAHEAGPAMRWPLVFLAGGCGLVGLGGPLVVGCLGPVLSQLSRLPAELVGPQLEQACHSLWWVVGTLGLWWIVVAGLMLLRRAWLKPNMVQTGATWGCGYARPAARMQYTAAAYAQPLTNLFRGWLRSQPREVSPAGYFPAEASLATETPDLCHGNLYHPAFVRLGWALSKLRWLQAGRVQTYVLYIALTLLALLLWKLG